MNTLKRLMTAVLLASTSVSAVFGALPSKVFAPYVDTSLYPTFSLTGCYNQTGQKYFMLAFIVAGGGNAPMWGGVTPVNQGFMLSDIQSLRNAGGDVGVSFGGADGTPIDVVITDVNSLVTAYSQVIDAYSLTWIDFDVEGSWIADSASVARRNQAAAKLQAKYPGLRVSYTLPVLTSGLTQDGINVINNAKSAGVNIFCVNVMAMDYGGANSSMGSAATSAAQATHGQTGLNIGITPMIGQNDSAGEIFTLSNAGQVLSFAQGARYVNMLAFWSAGRDNGGCPGQTTASATCSGVSQSSFQFTTTFKPFSGGSNGGGCPPTTITPYVQVNGAAWQQTSTVTVNSGATVKFGPQPTTGGSWSWTGQNGFTATTREVTITGITGSASYTAKYINSCGTASSDTFVVTVNGSFSGNYELQNVASALALTVAGSSTANGAAVVQMAYNATASTWKFAATDSGYYQITSVNSGKDAVVQSASTASGAKIVQ